MDEETNTVAESTQNTPQPGPSSKNEHGNEVLVNADDDDRWNEGDICRVCRNTGEELPLFHPCLCTGSIKYVHQNCLLEWLKYSKKDVCELCNHKFIFRPVYREDMPERLPMFEIAFGLFSIVKRYFLLFLTYCLAVFCWLGIVPLIACRVHRMVFEGSVLNSFSNLYTLNVTSIAVLFTPEHVMLDIMRGSVIVAAFLCTFILLVFLREQIVNGGPPELFNLENAAEGDNEHQADENRIQGQLNRLNLELDDRRAHLIAGFTTVKERLNRYRERGVEIEVPEGLRNLINLDITTFTEQLQHGVIDRDNLARDLRNLNEILDARDEQGTQNEGNDNPPDPEMNGNLGDMEEERNNIANLIGRVREMVGNDMEPPVELRDLVNMDENRLTDYLREGRNNDNQGLNDLIHMMDNPDHGEHEAQGFENEREDEQGNPQVAVEQQQEGGNGEEGDNWGRDVERIVEDLTWQRLFGLDGSLAFIEHVIWMISLNIIFIIVWMFFPCKLGEFFLHLANVRTKGMYFEAMINFATGYILLICAVVIAHRITKVLRLKDAYWLLGFFYLMMKVSLLIALEIFVFPFFCGWWLDICSLPLTGSTLGSRLKALSDYPIGSLFVHWLIGMVDVFYSASFVLVLRELLRPGVLWFVRDLNDPEFQPIQEMIDQGFVRHFRRLIASTTLFFGIIFIMVYLPLRLILAIFPSVLPYAFTLSNESPLGEFSFELILLQFILPSVLEQASTAAVLKAFVIQWCKVVGGWLGLDEYLLPRNVLLDMAADAVPVVDPPVEDNESNDGSDDESDDDQNVPVQQNEERQLLRNVPDDFPKPEYFGFRILALLGALAVTAIAISFMIFVIPVTLGRNIVYLMLNSKNPNDLYTLALGLYIVWLLVKAGIVTKLWIQQGWGVFCSAAIWLGRVLIAAVPLGIIIPYMIGIYFQLLVVGPLRVATHQTPLYFPFKDWAMGIVHFKLFCASVFVGPDWWLKASFERLYEDGVRNYRLGYLYMRVVLPSIVFISFLMCFPYVIGVILAYILGLGYEGKLTMIRYMYPSTVSIFLLSLFIAWQWKKLKKLANKIRNDKYLIGTQLVNFYRESQLKLKQN